MGGRETSAPSEGVIHAVGTREGVCEVFTFLRKVDLGRESLILSFFRNMLD